MVEGCRLAFASGTEHDGDVLVGCEPFVGGVGRAVGYPHHFQLPLGVVQLVGVLHFHLDDVLLVVGADHECHLGQIDVAGERLLEALGCDAAFA